MAPTTPSNTLVGTTGNDILTSPGSVATLVQGLQGNDTVTLSLAGDWAQAGQGNDRLQLSGLTTFSGSVEAGEGNDSLTFTANTFNGAYVGMNAGNDTINLGGATLINSSVGAGQGFDSLILSGGTFTTSRIEAGKGGDTINFGTASTFTASSIQASDGQDRINATGLTSDASSLIGGGKGTDSIVLAGASLATVAGGGLADTISFVNAAGAAVVYGDALGTTTEGTGTGGAADGADLISFTANAVGTTVYGAGANDTISFSLIQNTGLINGGNGADLLGTTALIASVDRATVNGGNGQDSIILGSGIINSGLVLGGAGADSIYLVSNSGNSGGSINGGDGNDTISMIAPAYGLLVTGSTIATVNGGAGTDAIVFNASGGAFAYTGATGSLIGQVVYEAGDSLTLGTGLAVVNTGGAGATNWLAAGAPVVYVATAISALNSGTIGSVAGSIGVFDNGDDMVIGISTGATSSFAVINVIGGDDAIKTTVVGANVALNASNFGFALATSNGNISISFS